VRRGVLDHLSRLADIWIGRHAAPSRAALDAVAGLAPAVVVTGGSRGIGLSIARRFAEAGRDVLVVARSAPDLAAAADELRRTANGSISVLALDVARSDAAVAIDRHLEAEGRYADVVVNNAAVGLDGAFAGHPPDAIDALVALNVAAVTRLTRHWLPAMIARGRGGIVNVASLGGYVPGPYQAAYYASKAYVLSLTAAIAAEAAGGGVRIAAVAPGPVETGFHAAMGADNAMYRWLIPALTPDRIARASYRGFMLGQRTILPGIVPPVAALVLKIAPLWLSVPLTGWLLRPPTERR